MKTLSDIINNIDRDGSKGLKAFTDSIENVISLALDLGGIIAVIMILYGALLYMTAYGEESKVGNAKKTLLWSILGLVVIALARVIKNLIISSFGKVQ